MIFHRKSGFRRSAQNVVIHMLFQWFGASAGLGAASGGRDGASEGVGGLQRGVDARRSAWIVYIYTIQATFDFMEIS